MIHVQPADPEARVGAVPAAHHGAGGAALARDELETLYIGLVRAYHAPLIGYVHSLVPGIQQAEDVVQDTFVRAYASLPTVGGLDNPKAWLYRIATNLAIDHIRRGRRVRWVSLDRLAHVLRGAEGPGDPAAADPVRRALAALAPDERTLLMLFAQAELTAPEVAEVLGITAAAARKRRQRAREAFMLAYRKAAGP